MSTSNQFEPLFRQIDGTSGKCHFLSIIIHFHFIGITLILNTVGSVIRIISVKPIVQDVQLRTKLQQIENKLAPMRKQIKGKFLLNTVQLEKKLNI